MPVQTGIPREISKLVDYREFTPTDVSINRIVYCFWVLKTKTLKSQSFDYLVLPDGCIDIVFDISKTPEYEGALIMTPSTVAQTVQIRSDSMYVGIRLHPGAWHANPVQYVGAARLYDSLANYDFTSASLKLRTSSEIITGLQSVVRGLMERKIVDYSPLINLSLAESFLSVEEMTKISGYSRRQLQRILRDSVGYAPHDFIKVIRFQRALRSEQSGQMLYFDQSHFIRECKRITGLTPVRLHARYDLMSGLSKTQFVSPVTVKSEIK